MIVTIRLFARVKDVAGTDRVMLTVDDGAVVADVRRELVRKYPELAGLIERSAFAVDDELATEECVVSEGAELALLPPVSGGGS